MPATHAIEPPLIEVFSSIQGEGILIGCRQLFVRFAECNLSCEYCDTPFQPTESCLIETAPGSGQYESHPNPYSLHDLTSLVMRWQHATNNLHHSLSLTGGEPLLHADALSAWLPQVQSLLPIFLETNGTLPAELEKVLPLVDYVSMDIKGSAVTGVATPWTDHADFLALGREHICQVKLVVSSGTTADELKEAARLTNRYAPNTPFVIQPLTKAGGLALGGEELLALQKLAGEEHHDVRVIPQIHPWLGIA